MGQKDLGTCIILSLEDTKKLRLNLKNLEFVGEVSLSPVKGFFDIKIKRKLRKEIEKVAEIYSADIAVINKQSETFEVLINEMSYDFSLYKYKK